MSQNASLLKVSALPSMPLVWWPEMLKYHLSFWSSILWSTGAQWNWEPGGEGSPYLAKFVQAWMRRCFTKMSSSLLKLEGRKGWVRLVVHLLGRDLGDWWDATCKWVRHRDRLLSEVNLAGWCTSAFLHRWGHRSKPWFRDLTTHWSYGRSHSWNLQDVFHWNKWVWSEWKTWVCKHVNHSVFVVLSYVVVGSNIKLNDLVSSANILLRDVGVEWNHEQRLGASPVKLLPNALPLTRVSQDIWE